MSALQWPYKDPDAVLDYGIDWTSWLNGDVIATSIWVVPEGITAGDESKSENATTIWLSGGAAGGVYKIVNRITTAAGREIDQGVTLRVVEA